jgi:hypothetical protein
MRSHIANGGSVRLSLYVSAASSAQKRDGVAGDQGWPLYLQRYGNLLAEKR